MFDDEVDQEAPRAYLADPRHDHNTRSKDTDTDSPRQYRYPIVVEQRTWSCLSTRRSIPTRFDHFVLSRLPRANISRLLTKCLCVCVIHRCMYIK